MYMKILKNNSGFLNDVVVNYSESEPEPKACQYANKNEIVLVECADFLTLSRDIHDALSRNPIAHVVIVAEEYQFHLIHVLYPFADLVDRAESFSLGGIANGHDLIHLVEEPVSINLREREYLKYLSFGMNGLDTCRLMKVSERTLKRIKANLMMKTGLNTTQQLTLYAAERTAEYGAVNNGVVCGT